VNCREVEVVASKGSIEVKSFGNDNDADVIGPQLILSTTFDRQLEQEQ
jgi:hypothetical protein